MHLAVVGAFPFPLPQGSQVYAAEQARALVAAGAKVALFCYGRGVGEEPADLDVRALPAALSPRRLAAGPSPGKPAADLLLLARLVGAQRRRRFDAVLAHNGEAALVALAARQLTGTPVVYVAHTLLGEELDAYGPDAWGGPARRLGGALDRQLAGRADALLALCGDAALALAPHARGPWAVIPPGLTPAPAPDAAEQRRACSELGVEPGRFGLYTGNLDRYQDLEVLAAAAGRVPEIPVVVASHAAGRPPRGVRWQRVDPARARALTFACGAALLPRRRAGGFPIKLLNYMEAARPIVARQGIADGLEHGRSAWLVPRGAGPEAFAEALRTLLEEPERAADLGRGARVTLERRHAWPELARRTLELARAATGRARLPLPLGA